MRSMMVFGKWEMFICAQERVIFLNSQMTPGLSHCRDCPGPGMTRAPQAEAEAQEENAMVATVDQAAKLPSKGGSGRGAFPSSPGLLFLRGRGSKHQREHASPNA